MKTIGGGVLVGLLLALTLAPSSATRIHTWPWAMLAAVYWMTPVVLALVAVASGRLSRWPNRMLPVGLGLFVAAAAASALASPFPDASLPRIWPALGGAALYAVLHCWLADPGEGGPRGVLLGRIISIVAAIVILASASGWARWPLPWGVRNEVPFGHSIYTAGFAVLALPWFVLATWRSRGWERALWSAVLSIALIVLASTSSRGGALAFGVTAAVAAAVFALRTRWSAARKAGLALGLVALAGAAILTNPRLRALTLDRSWNAAASESNRQRSAMIAAGWKMGWERPLLGWGPGTVPLAYPRMRAHLEGGVENVLELHNTPIQIWATLGLAGAVALVLFGAGAAQAAVRRLRETARVAELHAAGASLGGYFIFSLTDHQFDLPIINAMTAASLAFLTRSDAVEARARGFSAARDPADPAERRRTGSGPIERLSTRVTALLVLGLSCGMVFLTIPLVRDLQARHAYESALVAWENGRTEEWLAGLDHAAAVAPADPFYQHQAAGALLDARRETRDPNRHRELARVAIQRLEHSLRTGAHQEFAHFNLGWLNLELDQATAAAGHFIATAQLVPDKGGVYFGLGLAFHASGRPAEAVRAFALEWLNDPRSLTSPAWEIPALASIRPAVTAEVLQLFDTIRGAHAMVASVEALTHWWLGKSSAVACDGRSFNSEMNAFVEALPAIGLGGELPHRAAWARLYAAWRTRDFAAIAGKEPEFAAALERRRAGHSGSFREFLVAPVGVEPALMRTYRRERKGYGVLALHPEGPVLKDEYIVQENRLITGFAAELFPPKGWLPGRILLSLLPETLTASKDS